MTPLKLTTAQRRWLITLCAPDELNRYFQTDNRTEARAYLQTRFPGPVTWRPNINEDILVFALQDKGVLSDASLSNIGGMPALSANVTAFGLDLSLDLWWKAQTRAWHAKHGRPAKLPARLTKPKSTPVPYALWSGF